MKGGEILQESRYFQKRKLLQLIIIEADNSGHAPGDFARLPVAFVARNVACNVVLRFFETPEYSRFTLLAPIKSVSLQ